MEKSPATIHHLRLVDIDGSPGIVLPTDVLARLGVAKPGDLVDISEEADVFLLHRHGDGDGGQMGVARDVMTRRRDALDELSKSPD